MDKNLPIAPEAIGNYVTYKKIGNYVYTSGHVPITEQKKYIGKVPTEISIDEAYKAAELCAELTIATIKKHGSIDNLQPVNVIGFVNANEVLEITLKFLTDSQINFQNTLVKNLHDQL